LESAVGPSIFSSKEHRES